MIPENLPAQLLPIAWLVGRWEGTGVVEYPDVPTHRFRQEVEFTNNGLPYLEYRSHTWVLDDAGERPLGSELGYWRVVPSAEEAPRHVDVEVLLVHPDGVTEIYLGRAGEGRVDLATDVVARTDTAPGHAAGKRLFGLVHGDLMWAYDLATTTRPLATHSSAQLQRVADTAAASDAGSPA